MTIVCPAQAAVERLNAGVIARVLPTPILDGALGVAPRARRRRKRPDRFMLLCCVLMGLSAGEALLPVLRRILGPVAAGLGGATAGALCQARYRLGARPVVAARRAAAAPGRRRCWSCWSSAARAPRRRRGLARPGRRAPGGPPPAALGRPGAAAAVGPRLPACGDGRGDRGARGRLPRPPPRHGHAASGAGLKRRHGAGPAARERLPAPSPRCARGRPPHPLPPSTTRSAPATASSTAWLPRALTRQPLRRMT